MEVLLPHISKWFLDKQEHFTTFAQADSRIEGWFKTELPVLFNRLVASQVIEEFEREANVPSPKDRQQKRMDPIYDQVPANMEDRVQCMR